MSGRAASIGLEDRFMGIKDQEGVREKLIWLIGRLAGFSGWWVGWLVTNILFRLAGLVAEDGRKPTTLKVTMRDCCKDRREKKTFSKESRQCKIQPRILITKDEVLEKEEAVGVALSLVGKMVNFKDDFQLTLLGVAVTDFLEEVESKASIKKFFSTKKEATSEDSDHTQPLLKPNTIGISPTQLPSNNCLKRSLEEDSTETSLVLKKSRKVEATALEKEEINEMPPAGCDPEVWAALPPDLQRELINTPSLCHSYQSQGPTSEGPASVNQLETQPEKILDTAAVDDVTAFNCPAGLDPEVFRMLPEDIKEEIEAEAKAKSRSTVDERPGDLFSAPSNLSLAHCISQDCAMGKGIAKQFAERIGQVDEIRKQHVKVGGVAILKHKERYIYNLVTKEKYHEKPTMADLRSSLLQMRKHIMEKGVKGVAMPRIGCGLDLLDWRQVKSLLEQVFQDSGINIVIYTGLSTAAAKPKTNESILKYFSKK